MVAGGGNTFFQQTLVSEFLPGAQRGWRLGQCHEARDPEAPSPTIPESVSCRLEAADATEGRRESDTASDVSA
jgi:hypothetical protein